MENVLYSFNVWLKKPSTLLYVHGAGSSSASIQFDTIITLFGQDLDDALRNMPDDYINHRIVRVEYPIGWPNFPIWPPSTCTAGVVGVNPITGEHYLRRV